MLASTTGDILSSLLPFVLLMGFWFFLMRKVGGDKMGNVNQPIVDKLEEIRRELEGIREALRHDPFGRR
jgi:ATP-dependent Zn protease